jgi:hypothetical protein
MEQQQVLQTLGRILTQQVPLDFISTEQWPKIIEAAKRHRLGPLLYSIIKQSEFETTGAADWSSLTAQLRQTAMQFTLYNVMQARLNEVFTQSGIPCIWLKGIWLAKTTYPDPVLRPMGDLDVLVPFEQRERALDVVQQLGFNFRQSNKAILFDSDDPLIQGYSHHYHLVGGVSNTVILEVHFQLLGHELTFPLNQLDWFWTQVDKDNGFQGLRPEANLLYLCAHAELQHGEAQLNLLRYYDLHCLISNYAVDWALVVSQAVLFRWTYAVERALTLCIEFFETPIPVEVLMQLREGRPYDEDTSRLEKLQRGRSDWELYSTRLRRMTWGDRLHFALRVSIPSREYMCSRYAIAEGQLVWPYYPYRWYMQLCKIFNGLHNQAK